jgi:hypothetical protein
MKDNEVAGIPLMKNLIVIVIIIENLNILNWTALLADTLIQTLRRCIFLNTPTCVFAFSNEDAVALPE